MTNSGQRKRTLTALYTGNILNRMACYDFKSPIHIVCFDEENSNDEVDLTLSPDLNEKEVSSTETVTSVLETQITKNSSEIQITNPTKTKKRKEKSLSDKKTNDKKRKKKVPEETSSGKTQFNINHEYINDELKIVSNCLILTLESYYRYIQALKNRHSLINDITLSKNNYYTTKQHFFHAAYDYVITNILPNEANQQFNQIFLNYTTKEASKKLITDCHTDIRTIYFEIIQWAKSMQSKTIRRNSDTTVSNRQIQNAPIPTPVDVPITVAKPPPPYPTNTDQTSLCIFSSGPVGSEISINIDKSMMSNKNPLLREQLSKSPKSLDQNKLIHRSNEFLTVSGNFSHDKRNIPKNNNYESRYAYHEPEGRIPQYQVYQNLPRNVANENNQAGHTAFYNYYNTTNNYQSVHYSSNSAVHRTAQMPPNSVVNQNGIIRTFERNHQNQTSVPHHLSSTEHVYQMSDATQPPVVQTDFSNGPDLTRSSVSTDSGFISPVASKSRSNAIEDIMNELMELETTLQSVKSPADTVICHVCHTTSSLMCSACYKTYYCSSKCQRVDWEAHRVICQNRQ